MLEKIQNFRETGIIAGQFASGGKATERPIPYQYGLSLSFNAKIIKEPCIFCIQIFILALCNFDRITVLSRKAQFKAMQDPIWRGTPCNTD